MYKHTVSKKCRFLKTPQAVRIMYNKYRT